MECQSHVLRKVISPRNEKFFCLHKISGRPENSDLYLRKRKEFQVDLGFISFASCERSKGFDRRPK